MATRETHRLAMIAPVAHLDVCRALIVALVPTGWSSPPFDRGAAATEAGPATWRALHTACTPEFAALPDWALSATDPEIAAMLAARGVVGVTPADVRATLGLMRWATAPAADAETLADDLIAAEGLAWVV